MSFKVQPTHSGLCHSCGWGFIIEFDNGSVTVQCDYSSMRRVLRPVVKCSEYRNKNSPSKEQMEKIAWVVTTDGSGQKIGFKPPKKER